MSASAGAAHRSKKGHTFNASATIQLAETLRGWGSRKTGLGGKLNGQENQKKKEFKNRDAGRSGGSARTFGLNEKNTVAGRWLVRSSSGTL